MTFKLLRASRYVGQCHVLELSAAHGIVDHGYCIFCTKCEWTMWPRSNVRMQLIRDLHNLYEPTLLIDACKEGKLRWKGATAWAVVKRAKSGKFRFALSPTLGSAAPRHAKTVGVYLPNWRIFQAELEELLKAHSLQQFSANQFWFRDCSHTTTKDAISKKSLDVARGNP